MTANDVMREIRELDKTLPSIGVSGDLWEEAIQRQSTELSECSARTRTLFRLIGNIIDHWDCLSADVSTDPDCDGLCSAIEQAKAYLEAL